MTFSVTQSLLTVSVITNFVVLFGRHQPGAQQLTIKEGVVEARELKIVDEEGEVCVRIRGSHRSGGMLEMYAPSMKERKSNSKKHIVTLGSAFPGQIGLHMWDSAEGKHQLDLGIHAADESILSASSSFGSLMLSAGRRRSDGRVLLFTEGRGTSEKAVIFER